MNYGDNKSIQAINVFKFNSKMICVMTKQLVDSPDGLQSFNTKLLAWGLHSDQLCSMNLGYKLPQRLANHTFSVPVSFPLSLKCPLICLIDLCGGGANFVSSCQSPKKAMETTEFDVLQQTSPDYSWNWCPQSLLRFWYYLVEEISVLGSSGNQQDIHTVCGFYWE